MTAYKAIMRIPLDDQVRDLVRLAYGTAAARAGNMGNILRQRIDSLVGDTRRALLEVAGEDLADTGRQDHLLNLYLDMDGNAGLLTATWTFSDPDTALMFKLTHG